MTTQPGNRLILPNKADPTDPANFDVLERWAQNNTVNQIIPGTGVTIDTQTQAMGKGAEGTNIVTVNASGGGIANVIRLRMNTAAIGWGDAFPGGFPNAIQSGVWDVNLGGYGRPASIFMGFPTWTFNVNGLVVQPIIDAFDSGGTTAWFSVNVWQSSAPLVNSVFLYADPAIAVGAHGTQVVDVTTLTVYDQNGSDLTLSSAGIKTAAGLDYACSMALWAPSTEF